MAKSTLRDVAKLANVSIGTVSKYLNEPEQVKPANREKIQSAIRKLNYTPNMTARQLTRGSSGNIMLCLLTEPQIESITWQYYLPVVRSINEALASTRYSLQIRLMSIFDKRDILSVMLENISGGLVDGIIAATFWKFPPEIISMFETYRMPFCIIDSHTSLITTNQVYIDNLRVVGDLMNTLHELGHREIGFLSDSIDHMHLQERTIAYQNFCSAHSLDRDRFFAAGEFTFESGYACVTRWYESGRVPTAVICCSIEAAAGALRAVQDKGFSVPGDMSVIGIGSNNYGKLVRPSLYVAEPPTGEMGAIAASELLAVLTGLKEEIPVTVLPYRMIAGQSVGPPKVTSP